MEWWHKAMRPMQTAWNGVVSRLSIRKRGLLKLRQDVRACQYEDVQVMWEMLRRNETAGAGFHVKYNNRPLCSSPYFGRSL